MVNTHTHTTERQTTFGATKKIITYFYRYDVTKWRPWCRRHITNRNTFALCEIISIGKYKNSRCHKTECKERWRNSERNTNLMRFILPFQWHQQFFFAHTFSCLRSFFLVLFHSDTIRFFLSFVSKLTASMRKFVCSRQQMRCKQSDIFGRFIYLRHYHFFLAMPGCFALGIKRAWNSNPNKRFEKS